MVRLLETKFRMHTLLFLQHIKSDPDSDKALDTRKISTDWFCVCPVHVSETDNTPDFDLDGSLHRPVSVCRLCSPFVPRDSLSGLLFISWYDHKTQPYTSWNKTGFQAFYAPCLWETGKIRDTKLDYFWMKLICQEREGTVGAVQRVVCYNVYKLNIYTP